MGRIFLDHIGGTRLFSCANCDTILTNRSELISTRFTGATGRAFLFNKVVNLQYSEVQDRVMLTGRHMVRDVSCKNCNSKLGWIYEFATEDSQRYRQRGAGDPGARSGAGERRLRGTRSRLTIP
ncbi:unnamed protein product, partial [Staurois parvus]